jgi:hypothetical protein
MTRAARIPAPRRCMPFSLPPSRTFHRRVSNFPLMSTKYIHADLSDVLFDLLSPLSSCFLPKEHKCLHCSLRAVRACSTMSCEHWVHHSDDELRGRKGLAWGPVGQRNTKTLLALEGFEPTKTCWVKWASAGSVKVSRKFCLQSERRVLLAGAGAGGASSLSLRSLFVQLMKYDPPLLGFPLPHPEVDPVSQSNQGLKV